VAQVSSPVEPLAPSLKKTYLTPSISWSSWAFWAA
jgi:hypothetical protein